MDAINYISDILVSKLKQMLISIMSKHEEKAQLFLDFDQLILENPANTYNKISVYWPEISNYKYFSVQSCVIPKNYYLLEAEYAYMDVTDGVNSSRIVIPSGNYNYLQLKTALLNELNALSFGTFTINFDVITAKYTFLNSTPGLSFILDANSTLGRHIGFENNSTHNFILGSLESHYAIYLQRTNSVLITSNLITGKLVNSILPNTILCIPDNSYVNSPVTFINNDCDANKQKIECKGAFYIELFDDSQHNLNPQIGANINLIFYK